MGGQQGLFEGRLSRCPIKGREGASNYREAQGTTNAKPCCHCTMASSVWVADPRTPLSSLPRPHSIFSTQPPTLPPEGAGGSRWHPCGKEPQRSMEIPSLQGLISPVCSGHTSEGVHGDFRRYTDKRLLTFAVIY